MTYGILSSDQIQTSVTGVSLGPGNATNFKNRIINGAMVIDQHNAGASVTPTTSNNVFSVDRWLTYASQASKYTVQQNAGSVTPPVGFSYYMGATSSSAYSIGATDFFLISQKVEGFNTADLMWGTANAKTVTLSCQVYSSLTGTFGGNIRNSANNYYYPFSYSIPVANTWTTISITIPGPTSGTWVGATNGIGLEVMFSLGTGSSYSQAAGSWTSSTGLSSTGAVSVVGTNGATWYVTGVQLEVGSIATGFEVRDYGRELSLCQRYFEILTCLSSGSILVGQSYAGSGTQITFWYIKQTKRTAPTIGLGNGASWYNSTPTISSGIDSIEFYSASVFYAQGTAGSSYVYASSEL